MSNIMVDIETLGTGNGAHIVSIGAYCLETGEKFYKEIQNGHQYREITVSTVLWWMQQSEEARSVFMGADIDKTPLFDALQEFSKFYETNKGDALWCKGLMFDVPILENAMRQYALSPPWDFRAPRCWRTLKNTLDYRMHIPEPVVEGAKHNALYDAIYQGEQLKFVLKYLVHDGQYKPQ